MGNRHSLTARSALLGASALSLSAVASAAPAQDVSASASPAAVPANPTPTSGTALAAGDIIVTAQRRSERLQDVPIAIVAVQQETLRATGVTTLFDINLVAPGVKVQQYNGFTVPMIRGVTSKIAGPGLEPPVATYVDGVYYGASSANTSSFNNIERIEVLKGPQGTLFGRNATGGLIQIITRDPKQEPSGEVNIGYGNYKTWHGNMYVTGGLGKKAAIDLAVEGQTQGDGYGTNHATGQEVNKTFYEFGVRSKLLLTPVDRLEIRITGDYNENHNSIFGGQRPIPFGVVPPAPYGPAFYGDAWDLDADRQPDYRLHGKGVSGRADLDLGSVAVANIVAYRHSAFRDTFDSDYTAYRGRYAVTTGADSQFSDELQLLYKAGGAVSWTLGAYYFDATGRLSPVGTFTYSAPNAAGVQTQTGSLTNAKEGTRSLAAYGQATVTVAEGLHGTVGLRYTDEKRTLRASTYQITAAGATVVTLPEFFRSTKFDKLTWRLSVDYDVTRDVMLYASYNRGFKSGGFNVQVVTLPSFAPETLDAYEAGYKTTLLDRRLTVNGAVYYYDYKNIQIGRSINGLTGTYNAPGEKIYGAEIEFNARVTDNFNLSGGYAYIHGRYADFPGAQTATPRAGGGYTVGLGNAKGNTVILTPTSSISLMADYRIPVGSGELKLGGNYTYNSRYFQEPDNVSRQPAYSLFGASAKWVSVDGFSVMLWGKNLSNRAVATVAGIQTFGTLGLERAAFSPPRTYGVTLGKRF